MSHKKKKKKNRYANAPDWKPTPPPGSGFLCTRGCNTDIGSLVNQDAHNAAVHLVPALREQEVNGA